MVILFMDFNIYELSGSVYCCVKEIVKKKESLFKEWFVVFCVMFGILDYFCVVIFVLI